MTMIRAQRHVLLAPNDGNGGGGDGAGAGAGSGQGKAGGGGDGGDGDVPEHVKKFVTAAIQGAFRPLKDSIVKQIPTVDSIKSVFTDAMKDWRPPTGDGGAGQSGGGGKDGAGQSELALQVKKLQDQLDSQTKARTKEREEADRREQERMRTEERNALTTALLKGGVPESRATAASATLFYDQQVIRRNEKGEICFALKKVYGGEQVEEAVPLDAGVAEWLKTDVGKDLLPPVDASGSGNRGGKARKDGNAKPTAGDAYGFVASSIMNGGGGR